MKNQTLLSAVALGIGLTLTLAVLLLLARATPAVRAHSGLYYVREGGASTTCITFTDPCGSIQQAINLATSPDDEVWVATGTYTENLTINHSVKLRGGWDISFTIQAPTTYPTIIDGNDEHNVRVENAPLAKVTIEGLTLRNGQDGIHVWTGNVTVERCTILDANKQGFEIDGGDVTISTTQIMTAQQGIEVDAGTVRVAKVHIAHISREGLLIEGSSIVTFTGSIIEDCHQQGVQVDQGSLWLLDNYVQDIISDGIRIEGGTAFIISNVVRAVIENPDNNYHGIEIKGNHVVSGNLVTDIDDRGIYAYDGAPIIVNNVVHDTGGDGIHTAASSTNVEIRGNTVYSTGNDGIDARGETLTVADNHVHGTQDRGINAEDGALIIANNRVHDTDGDGVRTAGSSTRVEIQGNTVYGTGNDGIDARGDNVTVSHNTVSGCTDNGIRVEGDENVRVEANWVLSNSVGLAVRGAPAFTITNNMIGDHVTASAELTGTGIGLLYHNTLAGSGTGAQGAGIVIPNALTVTLANNIIVSHSVGISATAGATLDVSYTLLWGNSSDPVSGTSVIYAPPLFMAPTLQNYHVLPESPAIDAGIDVGVPTDVDGDPRPISVRPDIGADETGILVFKEASPIPVQPGAPLTYTLRVTNTTQVTLTATITDILPDHVSPSGTLTWTPVSLVPDGVWTQTVVVTVETNYAGPLTNVVQATTDEGATGVYTRVLAPDLEITKQANPDPVWAGEQLAYTLYLTNTGDFVLHATVTDTLPEDYVTPTGTLTWALDSILPDGIWTKTVVVTTASDYTGPLTNVVQVTTDEGVTGIYTKATQVIECSIYLPLVLRNYHPLNHLHNLGLGHIPSHRPSRANHRLPAPRHEAGPQAQRRIQGRQCADHTIAWTTDSL